MNINSKVQIRKKKIHKSHSKIQKVIENRNNFFKHPLWVVLGFNGLTSYSITCINLTLNSCVIKKHLFEKS